MKNDLLVFAVDPIQYRAPLIRADERRLQRKIINVTSVRFK